MFKKMHHSFKEKINNFLLITLFICYIIILIWIVFLKCNKVRTLDVLANRYLLYNLHERWMFQFEFNTLIDPQSKRQFILNIPIFIPLTLFLPLLFKKENIIRDLLITLFSTLLIETIQLFTSLGGFDYKDIICNFIGGAIGCLIFRLLRKHTKDVVINYILLTLTIISIPFTMYCIINTIIHYDYYSIFFTKEVFKNLIYNYITI